MRPGGTPRWVRLGFTGARLRHLLPGDGGASELDREVREAAFDLAGGRLVLRLSGEPPVGPAAERLTAALSRELGLAVELAAAPDDERRDATQPDEAAFRAAVGQVATEVRAAGALLARRVVPLADGFAVELGSEAEREILERHEVPARVASELARRGLAVSVHLRVARREARGPAAVDLAELVRRADARLRRKRPARPRPLWTWGGDAAGDPVPVAECREPGPRVVVSGRVFETEAHELRGGRALAVLYVTDGSDSIAVRAFGEAGDVKELLSRLGPGLELRVRGTLELEPRSSQVALRAEAIAAFPAGRREDGAARKRVELHVHTRMSAMDGLTDVEALVARVASWGHEAVGVVDHGVVQAFPEAAAAARRHGVKVLYGMEAYLVDDRPPVVVRPDGRPIGPGGFLALDLETTGLSPRGHAIVEIGAVRFAEGEPAARFHTFVDPGRELSEKARELTGITPEMLRGAPGPAEAVERFLAFAGDLPVVAHNAAFDLGFLQSAALVHLGRPFRPAAVDTMWLARAVLPELTGHGLAQVTDALGVPLPRHHRALDDAEATGRAFLKLLARAGEALGAEGELTLEGLGRLSSRVPARLLRPVAATVFARSPEGLRDLYRLVTESHLRHFHRVPRLPKARLKELREGLVIGSGGPGTEAFEAWLAGEPEDEWLERLRFYDFLELVPAEALLGTVEGQVDEEGVRAYHRALVAAARTLAKPVLAVGDVHHLDPEDAACREVLLATQRSEGEPRRGVHLRTTEEMLAAFRHLGDEAERVVVDEPVGFARAFPWIEPIPARLSAPEIEGAAKEVEATAYARARELYGDPLPEPVASRLQAELAMIVGHGYAALYAIAARLVARSLADGYLVGSRGSVGSSLVATLLGITEVNPLPPHYVCAGCRRAEFAGLPEGVRSGFDLPPRPCPGCGRPMKGDGHDIPFASFLGFEGDKVPDIDLNFSGEYQARAHQAAEELLGAGSVYRAGTIATVAERTAYGLVRSYGEAAGRSLREAEVRRLVRGLAGVKRTTGQHPGGLMVVPRGTDPHEFTPLQRPANDPEANVTTHFDYHAIEGRLVKLDLLGHDDPTALKLLHEMTGVDPREVPFSDGPTREIFRGRAALGLPEREEQVGTLGIPEFGTRFVRGMLVDTRPETFAELVRISGLSHGTDVWANNARELTRSGTATLSQVIATRDDLYLYLIERGMEEKRAFDIGERVRKGRGLAPEDEEAMRALGIPEWYIESCRKITYLFPKAHAAAYVMMAFRIAWYKVHRPAAFYAAHFTIHAGDFEPGWASLDAEACRRLASDLDRVGASPKDRAKATLLELLAEMAERGIALLPIDLAQSDATRFLVEPPEAAREERPVGAGIRIPFVAAPGLGEKAARQLCEERARGPFRSRAELQARARLTRSVVEILERCGALAGLPEDDQIALF